MPLRRLATNSWSNAVEPNATVAPSCSMSNTSQAPITTSATSAPSAASDQSSCQPPHRSNELLNPGRAVTTDPTSNTLHPLTEPLRMSNVDSMPDGRLIASECACESPTIATSTGSSAGGSVVVVVVSWWSSSSATVVVLAGTVDAGAATVGTGGAVVLAGAAVRGAVGARHRRVGRAQLERDLLAARRRVVPIDGGERGRRARPRRRPTAAPARAAGTAPSAGSTAGRGTVPRRTGSRARRARSTPPWPRCTGSTRRRWRRTARAPASATGTARSSADRRRRARVSRGHVGPRRRRGALPPSRARPTAPTRHRAPTGTSTARSGGRTRTRLRAPARRWVPSGRSSCPTRRTSDAMAARRTRQRRPPAARTSG